MTPLSAKVPVPALVRDPVFVNDPVSVSALDAALLTVALLARFRVLASV